MEGKRFMDGKRPPPGLLGFPIIINLSFLIIGTAIRMYVEWNLNENKKKEVEKLSTTSQLYFLKNQINPHFFFNSLNTIYSLATKKSPDAPEAIITLSDLMRYMLYRTNKDFVPLQEEFDYINNYMKLQRLRIADDSNVSINFFGNVTNQKISPLLLISFIENAFKYGTDYKGNTEIRIIINVELNYLHFNCVNLLGSGKKEGEESGIGLKNTLERLNLLYPDSHKLITREEDGKFIVDLNLKLY